MVNRADKTGKILAKFKNIQKLLKAKKSTIADIQNNLSF